MVYKRGGKILKRENDLSVRSIFCVKKVEKSILDYYAFGFENGQRSSVSSDTDNTFGFNGKLRDKNLGIITNYDYGYRVYNPGLARFLSVDPLKNDYPGWSPYPFAMNSPIAAIDLDGKEILVVGDDAHQAQVADLMMGLSFTPHGKKVLSSAMTGGRILLVKDGDVHRDAEDNPQNGFQVRASTGMDGNFYDVLYISDDLGSDATNGAILEEELSIPESPVAAFGHELQHFIDGASEFAIAYGFGTDDEGYRSYRTFGEGEINAVKTENIIRTELGVPGLVTHYAGLEILDKIVDENKKYQLIYNADTQKMELSPSKIQGFKFSGEKYDYSQHKGALISPGMQNYRKSKVKNTSPYLSPRTNGEKNGVLYELDNSSTDE